MPLDLGTFEVKFLLSQDKNLNFKQGKSVSSSTPSPSPPHHLGGSTVGGPKVHIWFPLCQTHQRHSALEFHPSTHLRALLCSWHPEGSFRTFSHVVVLLMYCPYIVIRYLLYFNIFDVAAISMPLGFLLI